MRGTLLIVLAMAVAVSFLGVASVDAQPSTASVAKPTRNPGTPY